MASQGSSVPHHSNIYNIFILVLTVLSLAVMVLLLLPISEETAILLTTYDNLICVIFLIDFTMNVRMVDRKWDFFLHHGGWLDLLGSVPSFGFFRFTGLLRLARLGRLARISRLLRGKNKKDMVEDILHNRGQYAFYVTVLLALVILSTASVLVLQFESKSPDANITTGGDALWFSLVTITTVGYGDKYPVTMGGRVCAVFIMFAGVGIIGALASILASLLVPPPPSKKEEDPTGAVVLTVEQELAALKGELTALRQLLEKREMVSASSTEDAR